MKINEPTKDLEKRSDLDANCGVSDLAVAYAKAHELDVVFPAADELFIDIDMSFERDAFIWAFPMFQQLFPGALIVRNTPSKSSSAFGGIWNRHIVVKVPGQKFSAEQRVMLQAILGSDPKRELLTLKNISEGDKTPTLFFEKPEIVP